MFDKLKERLHVAYNVVYTNRITEDLKRRNLEYKVIDQSTPCIVHGMHKRWGVSVTTPPHKPTVIIGAQSARLLSRRVNLQVIQFEQVDDMYTDVKYSSGNGNVKYMLKFLAPLLDHIHVDWLEERMNS